MATILKGRKVVSGGSYTSYSGAILLDNPNLFFKFNNNTNNDSGISYPFTVNGTFTYSNHELFSGKKCADFPDSDTRHIEINQPALLPFSAQKPVLTIECLAYFKSVASGANATENFRIIWCAPGYHCFLGCSNYSGSDKTELGLHCNNGFQVLNPSFYLNQWKHFVGVINFKNGYSKFYIDGVLVGTNTNLSGTAIRSEVSSSVYRVGLGNVTGDYQNRFHGYLSHLAIYLNELSASKIAAHYGAIALGD